jgi:RNA polymerase sigma factor (sigma-70 family)
MSEQEQLRDFQTLLQEVQQGSEEAGRELYERYGASVLRWVRHRMSQRLRARYDSQDFAQQVWASFFDLRSNLENFRTPQELAAFLLQMARNKMRMATRRQQARHCAHHDREVRMDDEPDERRTPLFSRDPTPSAVVACQEQYERLVGSQSELLKKVVDLRIAGKSFREIAQDLGIHERSARRLIEHVQRKHQALQSRGQRSEVLPGGT